MEASRRWVSGICERGVDVDEVFSDRTFEDSFKSAPASVAWHCAWAGGGLPEHTLNVLRICDAVPKLYPAPDRDLLLASAMLHDVGKVRCCQLSTNEFTGLQLSSASPASRPSASSPAAFGRPTDSLPPSRAEKAAMFGSLFGTSAVLLSGGERLSSGEASEGPVGHGTPLRNIISSPFIPPLERWVFRRDIV